MFSRRSVIRAFGVAVPTAILSAGSRPGHTDPLPLAIKGYDPVAYFTTGAPARGLPDIDYEWDEQRYRFVSDEHRALFKADPARYAPQFANFCTMALAKGLIHEADPEYWLVSDGKLYLFAAEYGPRLFQQDVSGHLAKAGQNRSLMRR